MRLIVLLAGFMTLAGCATPCASAITEVSTRTLACQNGARLRVTFNPTPAPAHLEQAGFPPLELEPAPASFGYRFIEGGTELRGTFGADATFQRPGSAQTTCREEGVASTP
jgi:hypothetical protein